MKIGYIMQAGAAHILDKPFSGPAVHVRQVFTELQRMGHEVHLLARFDRQIMHSDDLASFIPVTVPHFDAGLFRLVERMIRRIQSELQLPYAGAFESMRFAVACRQVLAGCDLLYERMGWMGYGGGLAAKWLGIPLILEVNGDYLAEVEMMGIAPRGLQRRLEIALMQRAVRRAAYAVSAGDGWRERFIGRWSIDPETVVTIENGSEVVDVLDREQLRAFRAPADASQPIKLVHVGSFQPWQGVTKLIRATQIAIAHGANVHVFLIGAGAGMDEVRRLVDECSLRTYVTFAGAMPPHEFAPHLADADIGISAYYGRVEYSGLKLLDYKAAGLATIASGQNGQPVIICHGTTGLIVPPGDEQALAQAIVRLSEDTELRRRMGREARIEAETMHRWRHTVEHLDDLFQEVTTAYQNNESRDKKAYAAR